MKRRILSLALAVAMCFTVLSSAVIAEDFDLMGSATGDMISSYSERVWDWQEGQFGAMTDEQLAVLANAYAAFEADRDGEGQIKKIADDTAAEIVKEAGKAFFERESMASLYKWKVLRDIVDERIDISVDDPNYASWLETVTAFERENDEQVSPARPSAALNGIGGYSKQCTAYFDELAAMQHNGAAVTGDAEDAAKINAYIDCAYAGDNLLTVKDYLVADVEELMSDAMYHMFELGLQFACGEKVRGDEIFESIPDRDFKAGVLIFDESFVRFLMNVIPSYRDELVSMDKRDILAEIAGSKGTSVLSADNSLTSDSLYSVMKEVSDYVIGQEFLADSKAEAANRGYSEDALKTVSDILIEALKSGLEIVDNTHGVELVHLDAYLGRAILDTVVEGEETVYEMGDTIEIPAGEVTKLELSFSHSRYPFVKETLSTLPSFAQFDAEIVGDGMTVVEDENAKIGEVIIDATNAARNSEVTLNLYRGYASVEDENADEANEYRYVSTFTVKAVGDEPIIPEDPYVILEDVADVELGGEILVKADTNLPYVTVAVVKDGATIYAVVYTKDEIKAGITLNVPAESKVGDVYTVVVGTDAASDSDEFKVLGSEEEESVVLEAIADTTATGTITVKGTTTLPYVTVAIVEDGTTIYAVVYSKAEFENGIVLNAPADSNVGNVYTVIVGTDKAADSKTFKIIDEEPTDEPSDEPSSEVPSDEPSDEPSSEVPTDTVTGSIALTGSDTRYVKVGGTIDITVTPQDVSPADATVEIEWILEDGTVLKKVSTSVNDLNGASTIKVERLKKGTTTVTAVLKVNGVEVDRHVVTVKVPSSGGGGSVITKPDKPVAEHKCQWPDIAATATKSAHWAHETIDIMTINGYIKGYPDGLFRPDDNITRAEFSAIVYRILGLEKAEDGVLYDDTVGHWAEDIIATMSLPEGYGMLRGYGDGTFGPNDNITREQAVAIIARAKSAVWAEATEGAKSVFTDAEKISWWFNGEMDAAVTNKLITGYEDGSYKPQNFTTRAEACTLLARAWPEVLELS